MSDLASSADLQGGVAAGLLLFLFGRLAAHWGRTGSDGTGAGSADTRCALPTHGVLTMGR